MKKRRDIALQDVKFGEKEGNLECSLAKTTDMALKRVGVFAYRGICQCGDIADGVLFSCCDLSQHSTHDLTRPGLWAIGCDDVRGTNT